MFLTPHLYTLAEGFTCLPEPNPPGVGPTPSASWAQLTRTPSSGFPPIPPKALAKLGVGPQFIPFIVCIMRAEQSTDGSPPLSLTDTEKLVEILNTVRPPP